MELSLTNSQKIVALDKHRFRVLCCGRRWGKTTLAIDQMNGQASISNSRIAYIAPTYQQARDIAWEQLRKDCKDAAESINESRLEIRLVNQSLIVLRGWEAIETLRGQMFNLVVVDEIAMMRDFLSKWQEIIRPTLTDTKGEALFISTPKGFNHFYDLYGMEKKDRDYKSFHFTSYDNPHLPKEEIDKAKQELTEDRFSQEYLADFRKTEGLVYKEFDRDRHVYTDQDEENDPIYPVKTFGGVDFGFTNPAATLTIKKDGDGRYYVVEEWYKTQQTDAQIADYVAALKWNECYPDPENAGGIEELKRRGVNVRDVIKGKGSVKNGINSVRELFKSNRLYIHESCHNLIWELETYSYPDKKADHNEEENPIKENDHACFTKDTLITIPIGSVLYQKSNGIRNVYEFMGSKVTQDHPYLTQRGFVALDSLRYSDKIVLWKNKLLTELSLDDTQTQTGVSFGAILYLLERNLQAIKLNASTDIYGKNTTEKYLGVFISIIRTVTLLITRYLISNFYHQLSMLKNIWRKYESTQLKTLKSPALLLSNGTNLKRVESSMLNLVNYLGRISNTIKEIVINVAKNIKHRSLREVSSATIIAKLKHLGKEEVYSTVTTNGFFIAGGVVVSNCDAIRYALSMEPISKQSTVIIHRPPHSSFRTY